MRNKNYFKITLVPIYDLISLDCRSLCNTNKVYLKLWSILTNSNTEESEK
jgi:hypothetical protein